MKRPPKANSRLSRRNAWTFFRGFRDAITDPGVRVLIILTATIVCAGALFYSMVEGWGFIDSLYFAMVTIATVGYGDFAPQTTLGRLFTVGYIVIGIGLFVALASAFADHFIRRARDEFGIESNDDSSEN